MAAWASILSNEIVTNTDLNEAVVGGVFVAKTTFPSNNLALTKTAADSYVFIDTTSLSAKTGNSLMTKANFFPAAPLLLNTYSGAIAAYSLRKLSVNYTGSAIQVRRSSDNVTQNIGFVSGSLDTATLSSFIGANDGFVSIWYDQSGNSRDAYQTITANQPRIVVAGVIQTLNSKPSIRFDGNDDYLYTFSTAYNYYHDFYVAKLDNTSGRRSIYRKGYANSLEYTVRVNGGNLETRFDRLNGTVSNEITSGGAVDTVPKLISSRYNGITSAHSVNNNAETSQTFSGGTLRNPASPLIGRIGTEPISDLESNTAGANYWVGTISEVILYVTDQFANQSNIKSDINLFYSIY